MCRCCGSNSQSSRPHAQKLYMIGHSTPSTYCCGFSGEAKQVLGPARAQASQSQQISYVVRPLIDPALGSAARAGPERPRHIERGCCSVRASGDGLPLLGGPRSPHLSSLSCRAFTASSRSWTRNCSPFSAPLIWRINTACSSGVMSCQRLSLLIWSLSPAAFLHGRTKLISYP